MKLLNGKLPSKCRNAINRKMIEQVVSLTTKFLTFQKDLFKGQIVSKSINRKCCHKPYSGLASKKGIRNRIKRDTDHFILAQSLLIPLHLG